MPRPTVLIATTNSVMAYALRARLREPCRKLGLRLDVCSGMSADEGLDTRAYESAEELFDYLDSRPSMELADTLVVLDIGAWLEEAFTPKATADDQGWHVTENRTGVAVELVLRFPQVFPVILSPAVPFVSESSLREGVVTPTKADIENDQWQGFQSVWKALCTRHRLKKEGDTCESACANESLMALNVPLHFVSPLDRGVGLESTLRRFAHGMRCWFDPTGLRALVKNRFLGTLFGEESDWSRTSTQRNILLKRLGHVAVAIDEEREFALFNAYAAWKYGRRAWIVVTYAEFKTHPLWTVDEGDTGNNEKVVVLRDIDLRFPDVPTNEPNIRKHLKDIYSDEWKKNPTDEKPSKLGDSWIVYAISGEVDVTEVETGDKKKYFKGNESKNRLGQKGSDGSIDYLGLPKPVTSIYGLKGVLEYELKRTTISSLNAVRDGKGGESGHGAPYLNLAMAESMLWRARRCKDGPMENLIGALLAGEAYELLLGMSKTTALEALLVQHKREVAAEVEFPGVSHDIRVDERRRDIDDTLRSLYRVDIKVDKGSREGAGETGNGLIKTARSKAVRGLFLSQFWAELRIKYREGEQFEAAESANVESFVHSKWWPWRYPNFLRTLDGVALFAKRYALMIATTLRGWFAAVSTFTLVMTVWYAALAGYSFNDGGGKAFLKIWHQVVLGSLQLAPADGFLKLTELVKAVGFYMYLAVAIHTVVSYVLFGLFISMLYRKATRA